MLKYNQSVIYNGRPANLITLPLKPGSGAIGIIRFPDTSQAVSVRISELTAVNEKETGRPNSEPVSI